MKTTTATKKAYRQPQMMEIGDALKSTLGIFIPFSDNFLGARLIP